MNWFTKKQGEDLREKEQAGSPGKVQAREEGPGFSGKLKKGLSKTRDILTTDIEDLFTKGKGIDEDFLEELEERLITADIGVETAMEIIESLKERSKKERIASSGEIISLLKQEIKNRIQNTRPFPPDAAKPYVILVVGVNGVGKTTLIGKLANQFQARNKSVLVVAGDTFRAAAVEQLTIWAERAGAGIVKQRPNADPAAVAFDGVQSAVSRKHDVVLVDTAGRLHTKVNLMEELKKIERAVKKVLPDAPHEVLLVLDATTGQNALSQARMFHEALSVDSIALTKLDGTAKGGIVVPLIRELGLPIRYVGVGEGIDDLMAFSETDFADALF